VALAEHAFRERVDFAWASNARWSDAKHTTMTSAKRWFVPISDLITMVSCFSRLIYLMVRTGWFGMMAAEKEVQQFMWVTVACININVVLDTLIQLCQ
jgi:hypothetical protein